MHSKKTLNIILLNLHSICRHSNIEIWKQLFELEGLARNLALLDSLNNPTNYEVKVLLKKCANAFQTFLKRYDEGYPNFNDPNDEFRYFSNGENKVKGKTHLRLFDF